MKNIIWDYEGKKNSLRDKHATISVITFRKRKLSEQDDYVREAEQAYSVVWLKPMRSRFEQEWERIKTELNATFNDRGKNVALECLQFGGNHEFWEGFSNEYEITAYLKKCYAFAIKTIGFKQTDKNVVSAIIVTEPNRRNLFVYYLPITNSWQRKVLGDKYSEKGIRLQLRFENAPVYRKRHSDERPLLCHTEFWKQRGGETSYSELQERFYNEISKTYGAKRGESRSRLKYTVPAQAERYCRFPGDADDEMPPIKGIWV